MDKFIEDFSQRPTSQKILITIAVTLGILFIIGIFYVLTAPPQNSPSSETPQAEVPPSPTPFFVDVQPDAAWRIYGGKIYQVSYPSDATVVSGEISGGGESFTISGTENSIEYNIEFQITDTSLTPLEDVYLLFKEYGFKEENVVVNNATAKSFKGQLKAGERIQEEAVVFENRGKVYKIQLTYASSDIELRIDNLFKGILSTFKFR